MGSTQSKGRAPNSWSTGACPCGLWSMTSKPFLSVHTGRLLPASLSYGDASPSAAMETQQSVTPQDRTRDVMDNPTLIVQSLHHWTHGRLVVRSLLLLLLLLLTFVFLCRWKSIVDGGIHNLSLISFRQRWYDPLRQFDCLFT